MQHTTCSNKRHKIGHLPTGMAEVVTAVAWEECDAIVMVTIVLLVICVCGTVPKHEEDRVINIYGRRKAAQCAN